MQAHTSDIGHMRLDQVVGNCILPCPYTANPTHDETCPLRQEDPMAGFVHHAKETQLMHLWHTHTFATISTDAAETRFLRDVLPTLARLHCYLADAIFALAALHQAHLAPILAEVHRNLGHFYRDRALSALVHNANVLSPKAYAGFFYGMRIHAIPYLVYEAQSGHELPVKDINTSLV